MEEDKNKDTHRAGEDTLIFYNLTPQNPALLTYIISPGNQVKQRQGMAKLFNSEGRSSLILE